MNLTLRELLYAMLDEMDDNQIEAICRLIGNLKFDEEFTKEALIEALNSNRAIPFLDTDK